MSGSIGYPGAFNPALFQAPPSNYGPTGYNQGYPIPQGYPAPQGYPGGFDPNMGVNPGFQMPPVNNGYGLQIPGFGTPAPGNDYFSPTATPKPEPRRASSPPPSPSAKPSKGEEMDLEALLKQLGAMGPGPSGAPGAGGGKDADFMSQMGGLPGGAGMSPAAPSSGQPVGSLMMQSDGSVWENDNGSSGGGGFLSTRNLLIGGAIGLAGILGWFWRKGKLVV